MAKKPRFAAARLLQACLVVAVGVSPSVTHAASSIVERGGAASASLVFAIRIPHVLIVDTRSGIVYTNDARGAFPVSAPVAGTVTRAAVQESTARGVKSLTRIRMHEGRLICLP